MPDLQGSEEVHNCHDKRYLAKLFWLGPSWRSSSNCSSQTSVCASPSRPTNINISLLSLCFVDVKDKKGDCVKQLYICDVQRR